MKAVGGTAKEFVDGIGVVLFNISNLLWAVIYKLHDDIVCSRVLNKTYTGSTTLLHKIMYLYTACLHECQNVSGSIISA